MPAIRRLVLLLAPLLIGGLVHAAPSGPGSAVEVANGRVSVRFVETPLQAAVEQLAASVGARVEWLGATEGTTVSTDLTDVSIAEALERVLRPHSYFVVTAGRTGALRRVVVMLGGLGGGRAADSVPVSHPWPPLPEEPSAIANPDGVDASAMARLDDSDPAVRRSVLDYVRAVGQDDPRRDMVLSRLLSDPDPQLREEALELHGGFAPARNPRRRGGR